MNDIPPRLQWDNNFGYCGETSIFSAGLYYGQYVSQYEARSIASMNAPQSKEGSQLLLGKGENDAYAATQMHLKAEDWKGNARTNTNSFLAWVKANVVSGYPVIIGISENYYLFDRSKNSDAGDPQYDHIVPVIGVSSKHPLTPPSTYHDDDVIIFSDNGLWSPTNNPTYFRRYPFGSFQANRREANATSRPIYSLPRGSGNYGVVITGIIDHDGKTLPVRLVTRVNHESPAIPDGSNSRPQPEALTLTVTVSGLKPNVSYNLYRYDSFGSVPNSAFNAQSSKASRMWKISVNAGSTYSLKENITSDRIAVYRAVPASAP